MYLLQPVSRLARSPLFSPWASSCWKIVAGRIIRFSTFSNPSKWPIWYIEIASVSVAKFMYVVQSSSRLIIPPCARVERSNPRTAELHTWPLNLWKTVLIWESTDGGGNAFVLSDRGRGDRSTHTRMSLRRSC